MFLRRYGASFVFRQNPIHRAFGGSLQPAGGGEEWAEFFWIFLMHFRVLYVQVRTKFT